MSLNKEDKIDYIQNISNQELAEQIYEIEYFWEESIQEKLEKQDRDWVAEEVKIAKDKIITLIQDKNYSIEDALVEHIDDRYDMTIFPNFSNYVILGLTIINITELKNQHKERDTDLYLNQLQDDLIERVYKCMEEYHQTVSSQDFISYNKSYLRNISDEDVKLQDIIFSIDEQKPNTVLYEEYPDLLTNSVKISDDFENHTSEILREYEKLAEMYLRSLNPKKSSIGDRNYGGFRYGLNPRCSSFIGQNTSNLLNNLSAFNPEKTPVDLRLRNILSHNGTSAQIKNIPSRESTIRLVSNEGIYNCTREEFLEKISRIRLICLLIQAMIVYKRNKLSQNSEF